jgi:uncharacterized protein with von Willebrand factor type A (vWA) domain
MDKQPAKTITGGAPVFLFENTINKISFENKFAALRMQMNIKGNFTSSSDKHIIIVLDKSGSMAGTAMRMAQAAVKEMCEYLHNTGNKEISLITYNRYAELFPLHNKSIERTPSKPR